MSTQRDYKFRGMLLTCQVWSRSNLVELRVGKVQMEVGEVKQGYLSDNAGVRNVPISF
jgi:hypothetical protein